MDAYIIHDNPALENKFKRQVNLKNTIYLHFIDEGTLNGKKEAFRIKGEFAARKTPFIGIFKDDKIFKGFYSEASKDVIKDFINWINEET